jgi:hypothetical protein
MRRIRAILTAGYESETGKFYWLIGGAASRKKTNAPI